MAMHNPPHPGEFIRETYIELFDISIRSLAENLDVAASTPARIVSERSAVSPEMALRLCKALGRSPESWLAIQDSYDLWQARRSADLARVRRIQFDGTAWKQQAWLTWLNSSPPCLNSAKYAPATTGCDTR
jgi:addiction module HigA family antidote